MGELSQQTNQLIGQAIAEVPTHLTTLPSALLFAPSNCVDEHPPSCIPEQGLDMCALHENSVMARESP